MLSFSRNIYRVRLCILLTCIFHHCDKVKCKAESGRHKNIKSKWKTFCLRLDGSPCSFLASVPCLLFSTVLFPSSIQPAASVAHLHRVARLHRPPARADRHGAQARPRTRRQLDLRLPPLSGASLKATHSIDCLKSLYFCNFFLEVSENVIIN